jgi:hypothetical protein
MVSWRLDSDPHRRDKVLCEADRFAEDFVPVEKQMSAWWMVSLWVHPPVCEADVRFAVSRRAGDYVKAEKLN